MDTAAVGAATAWLADPHCACDLVIADVSSVREDAFGRFLEAVRRHGCPLLFWMELSRVSVDRALRAAQEVATEVVFRDFDHQSRLLRALVRAEAQSSATALVLGSLSGRIARLPTDIRIAATRLFGWAPVPSSVDGLVRLTLRKRRSVERHLAKAGLQSGLTTIQGARVARTWAALTFGNSNLDAVAAAAGYDSARTYGRQFVSFVGVSPRKAASTLDTAAFVSRLVVRMTT